MNYDDDKILSVWLNRQAVKRGVEEHILAAMMIRMRIRAQANKSTFAMYVNDAIGYKMTPEQILYYSDNAFGCCDTIAFRRNTLRIHDLKTGESPTSVHQLEAYAALFCLEYDFKPFEINMEFRIYQHNEARIYEGDPVVITKMMDRIVTADKIIEARKREELV